MAESATASTIYDLGYQHYDGARLGRANAIGTLTIYSLRTAFGVGRGERAKLVPVLLALLAFAPAVVQVAMANSAGDASLISYPRQIQYTNFLLILFAAAQAPELLVVDRQLGTLSLYLSRSLRATDYAASKLMAMIAAVSFYSLLPQLVLFTGGLFVGGAPGHALITSWKTLLEIIAAGLAVAAYLASVSLSLSAFTTRKGYASASVIAFFLLLPILAVMSMAMLTPHAAHYSILGNPLETINGFARWIFGVNVGGRGLFRITLPLLGAPYLYTLLGTMLAGVAVLMWRYSRSNV